MEFYKNLYFGSQIRDPRQARKDLKRQKGHLLTYVLVLSENSEKRPQLEIMHSANLKQDYYRARSPFIIGIAEGRRDAIDLVCRITQESFDKTGQWNAAAYVASMARQSSPLLPDTE